MNHGFVYIMGNVAMPGYFKVGMTERSPEQRADELSSSTSIPVRFRVLAYTLCEDPKEVEATLHEWLSDMRVNSGREFFFGMFSEVARAFDSEFPLVLTVDGCRALLREMQHCQQAGRCATEAQWSVAGRAIRREWNEAIGDFHCEEGFDGNAFLDTFLEASVATEAEPEVAENA